MSARIVEARTTSSTLVVAAMLVVTVVVTVGAWIVLSAVSEDRVASHDGATAAPSVSTILVPAEIEAGEPVSVVITSEIASGIVEVHATSGLGRLSFRVRLSNGTGRFDLPPAVTQHAGVLSITAGDLTEQLSIVPSEVAEVVAPLVGPRTIVADGADTTLAVIFPVDRFGNQVANGTNVVVEWQQPTAQGTTEQLTTVTTQATDGMAFDLLTSGEVAGPTIARTIATTQDGEQINGAAIRIDEVPGTVSDIEISASALSGFADGRALVEIESTELFDTFDNRLADGTVGHFVFDGPSGFGVVAGTVQNGVFSVELVSPDKPGTLTGHVELHGRVSNEISIEFESAISGFEATLSQVGTDTVLRIDAALDPTGAFVADGTEVVWGEYRTQIRLGAAEIRLPAGASPESTAPIEILGTEVRPMRAEQRPTGASQ